MSINYFSNKEILVTGGTGLIGKPLVDLLVKSNANVTVVSLDDKSRANENVKFIKSDLRNIDNCIDACKNKEIVFHLAGVKGSPDMTARKPASFFYPTISFSFNMLEAARKCGVNKYLFTSSIGVYSPASVFNEEDVWKTFPSNNDKFAGWAKRMCELQIEAYSIEYNWNNISIVRPANVYGPFDNFDVNNAMVIPSLIIKALNPDPIFKIWGDGSPIRDFVYSKDVAKGMMKVVEKGYKEPINLGSGEGVSIKQIVDIIVRLTNCKKEIFWDTSMPAGDLKRLMNIERQNSLGIKNETNIEEGIKNTIDWYQENKEFIDKRYNPFLENVEQK